MAERGRLTSIGERVRQVHLDHHCPGGAGVPVAGSGPIGLSTPSPAADGWDDNSARAAGLCGRCGQPIMSRQDVRRRPGGAWVHEACPDPE